ncbi:hypothetical protein Tco_1122393 [Tanacetum coccineum]|uniref:Transposase (Putative), gypsy type n=1 Tax=Tanacetum coccineum TaxID=301880 RepID=A0ABQ5J0E3_9ASTR
MVETTSSARDSRRLMSSGFVIPCTNLEILMHSGALLTSLLSSLYLLTKSSVDSPSHCLMLWSSMSRKVIEPYSRIFRQRRVEHVAPAISGLDLVLKQVRDMESYTNEKKPSVLSWGRTPRLDSGIRGSLVLGFPSISFIVVVARVGPLSGKDTRSIVIAEADLLSRMIYRGGPNLPASVLLCSGRASAILGLILSKDPPPKLSRYDAEACEFLRTHTTPFWKFPEPFLYWVGISRYYTLDEKSYPTFWDGEEEMDLFVFIRHYDPTKVRVGERNLADREVKLLKMIEGRTVALDPPATAASGGSGESIDKLFDEEHDVGHKHSVENDDDALEEKLRDDHQSLPPNTSGKSLATLRGMIPEGSDLPSGTTEPLIVASQAPIPNVGPVDSVSGLNLRTRHPHVRSVVADALVVTVAITTIVDADVAAGSKVRDTPKDFEDIRDSASAGRVESDSMLDDPYTCRDLTDRVAPPAMSAQLRAMDYDQLYFEFNVGVARQVCLGAESEAAKAISLRSQLSVVEAADATKKDELASLSSQVAKLTANLSGLQLSRDELNSKVASLEFERDCLASQITIAGQRWILSRGLKLVLAKCLSSPEYLFAMGEAIGCAIDKGIQDRLAAGIEHGRAGRSIADVVAFNPSAEGDYVAAINALRGVNFLLLDQLEANKDSSMADIMDLLRLQGPACHTPPRRKSRGKKRKRKVAGDASGFAYLPKKLRDDHQSLPPNTSRKSLATLRGMIPEGFDLLSGTTEPLIVASQAPIPDARPVDSVSGLNLRTRPPHVRYVVSSDSSYHSDSYSEATSFARSLVADAPVVTVAVTTTADADVAAGSKVGDTPKDFEDIRDSASAGGSLDTETMHRVYIPRWKVTNDSMLDDPYTCRDLMDLLALPALFAQLRAMDYDQLYSEFNVGVAWQVCLGAEMRMRAGHTLEKKGKLEDKYAEQTTLLSEKDAEIAHLKSLLSLKESEAAEAISLRSQLSVVEAIDAAKSTDLRDLMEKNFALEGERNILPEKVATLESVTTSKEDELVSLSSQVAKLTADLSGLQLSRDELNSKVDSLESERDCLASQKNSLESAFELFKEKVEKMQDEQMGVLSERVAAIDSDLMEMVLYMDVEFYPRCLTTIARRRWILSRRLKLVLAKCFSSPEYLSAIGDYVDAINGLQGVSFSLLAQLEAHKDSSMAGVIDLLCLEGPAAKTSEASQLQPLPDQLMIPIHRLEDQVIIGETSLAFSLEVAHNRVQRVRGDASARRLSLTDFILLLVEPLSARNLTGKASSSVDFTTTVTTALSTTFAQTNLAPMVLSTEVPPSPKIVFEEKELDTTPEHVPAP